MIGTEEVVPLKELGERTLELKPCPPVLRLWVPELYGPHPQGRADPLHLHGLEEVAYEDAIGVEVDQDVSVNLLLVITGDHYLHCVEHENSFGFDRHCVSVVS